MITDRVPARTEDRETELDPDESEKECADGCDFLRTRVQKVHSSREQNRDFDDDTLEMIQDNATEQSARERQRQIQRESVCASVYVLKCIPTADKKRT